MFRQSRFLFVLIVALSFAIDFVAAVGADPNRPVWSKQATSFYSVCEQHTDQCRPLSMPSPDGKSAVAITYAPSATNPGTVVVSLDVTTGGKLLRHLWLPLVGTTVNELVWSPDSKAFFINGGDKDHPYGGKALTYYAVFFLDAPELEAQRITDPVEQDMRLNFPPCKAAPALENCAEVGDANPDFAYTVAIGWSGGSSRLVVIAQLPCNGSLSGIGCQMLGYEVDVRTGKIVERLQPKQFLAR
jgi:hypothetical protein